MKYLLIVAVLALSACAGGADDKTPEPQAMLPPGGAVAASFDPSCPTDPACVCTMPKDKRPAMISTPERLLERFPWMPKEIPNACE